MLAYGKFIVSFTLTDYRRTMSLVLRSIQLINS